MLKMAILIEIAQLQLIKLVIDNRYAFLSLEMIQDAVLTQNTRGIFLNGLLTHTQ